MNPNIGEDIKHNIPKFLNNFGQSVFLLIYIYIFYDKISNYYNVFKFRLYNKKNIIQIVYKNI
jgi:hypothetical protein